MYCSYKKYITLFLLKPARWIVLGFVLSSYAFARAVFVLALALRVLSRLVLCFVTATFSCRDPIAVIGICIVFSLPAAFGYLDDFLNNANNDKRVSIWVERGIYG